VGFLNSKNGIIFLSIIWALGLASMCRSVCKGRDCYIVKPYQMNNILNNNYKHTDSKCYKYYPYPYKCP
jgi:hypothetical protein